MVSLIPEDQAMFETLERTLRKEALAFHQKLPAISHEEVFTILASRASRDRNEEQPALHNVSHHSRTSYRLYC